MSQKTPISLMNELAKANNLEPEYKVLEESGPAHKKTFRVELTLGEIGKWEGTGNSIKTAKHAAANLGLENCGLCLPEKPVVKTVNLTPTVELNGLAMKLGKATQYRDLPPKPLPSHTHGQFPGPLPRQMNAGFRGMSNMQQGFNHMNYGMHQQRQYNQYNSGYYPRQVPKMMRVSLTVGEQEFIGEGRDKQQARHNAAKKATDVLREELQTKMMSGMSLTNPPDSNQLDGGLASGAEVTHTEDEDNVKSEISLVYEEATRRKLLVDFADVNNIGPAHMKKFRVRATVGEFVTEGEGMRKKDAKKEAAIKMLKELKKLPEIPEADVKRLKNGHFKRANGPKGNKPKPKSDLDPTMNPISILGQILQGRHEPAPVYSLVEERGHLTKKEFVLQVTVGSHQATGVGSNKKTAKKNAAEAMLQLMGFRPTKEEKLAQQDGHSGSSLNGTSDPSNSRQLKPGLLPMVPELAKQFGCPVIAPVIPSAKEEEKEPPQPGLLNRAPGAPVASTVINPPGKQLSKVQALLQLAESKGLLVHISNYPKDNNEFISLVNVAAVPPITCCGSGFTPEAAEEDAANHALIALLPIQLKQDSLKQDPSSVAVPIPSTDTPETPVVMAAKE